MKFSSPPVGDAVEILGRKNFELVITTSR